MEVSTPTPPPAASVVHDSDGSARVEIHGPLRPAKRRAVAVFVLALGTAAVMLTTGIAWVQWASIVFFLAAAATGCTALYKLVQTNPTVVFDAEGITMPERRAAVIVPWHHLKSVSAIAVGYRPMLGITLIDPQYVQHHKGPTTPRRLLLIISNGMLHVLTGIVLLLQRRSQWRTALFKWSLIDTMQMNESLIGCHLVLEQFQLDRPVEQLVALAREQAQGRAAQATFVLPAGRFESDASPPNGSSRAHDVHVSTDHPPITPEFSSVMCRIRVRAAMISAGILITGAALLLVLGMTRESNFHGTSALGITGIVVISACLVRLLRDASSALVLDPDGLHVYGQGGAMHAEWNDIESIEQSRPTTGWAPTIRFRNQHHVVFLYWRRLRALVIPTTAERTIRLNARALDIDADRLLSHLQHFHHHFADEATTTSEPESVA